MSNPHSLPSPDEDDFTVDRRTMIAATVLGHMRGNQKTREPIPAEDVELSVDSADATPPDPYNWFNIERTQVCNFLYGGSDKHLQKLYEEWRGGGTEAAMIQGAFHMTGLSLNQGVLLKRLSPEICDFLYQIAIKRAPLTEAFWKNLRSLHAATVAPNIKKHAEEMDIRMHRHLLDNALRYKNLMHTPIEFDVPEIPEENPPSLSMQDFSYKTI